MIYLRTGHFNRFLNARLKEFKGIFPPNEGHPANRSIFLLKRAKNQAKLREQQNGIQSHRQQKRSQHVS